MAASVSAWSKPGTWAVDSEEHEAELLHSAPVDPPASDFPSLSAAATTKTKKKKNQTLSLAEFSAKSTTYSSPRTVFDETALELPSGPRERTAEELDRSRLGGGFRSYGGGRGGEDSSQRWGSKGGSGPDEGRRPQRESGPSKADEVDDWGAAKRSTVGIGFDRRGGERGERGERGSFFDSQSRADESDSWVSNKSSIGSEGRRYGGFERDRRGGFEREGSNGGPGADSDTWGRKREDLGPVGGFGGVGGANGRPRLVLQPRTLPVSPVSVEKAVEVAPAPVSAPVVVVPRQKGANPFGEARPREEVLAEKGQDWKEIDEKLETVKIKEAGEKVERGFGGGRRGFGSGNGNGREERSWRKPEGGGGDARPGSRSGSVEGVENGASEENGKEIDEQVTEG